MSGSALYGPSSSILQICECSICCEILREPKTLECEHSFCKECIEQCVEFDSYNKPYIRCPTCREETSLVDIETVSGLKAQLILKQILDGMDVYKNRCDKVEKRTNAVEGKLSPRCCQLTIEWYCCNCKSYFCKKCFNLHSLLSSCGIEFYEVKYNEEYDTFSPFCGRHHTFHRFACLRCIKTFCSYCKIDHGTEDCKIVSFKDYGSKFKDPLLNKIETMKQFKAEQKCVLKKLDESASNVHLLDVKLKKHIEEKKMVVLSHVLFLLQLVGKQILNNFSNELKEYEMAKDKFKDGIESKLTSVDDVLSKSEHLAEGSLIEIISRTKDLQDEFHKVLPEEDLECDTNPSELLLEMDTAEGETSSYMDDFYNDIQSLFGPVQLLSMNDDGSDELKALNTSSNNIDCSSSMLTKLNSATESRKYILKVLKQMGLLNNMDSKSVTNSKTADNDSKADGQANASTNYVKVTDQDPLGATCLPCESHGSLLLTQVQSIFPNAAGIRYRDPSNKWCKICLEGDLLHPPKTGWGENCYFVTYKGQKNSQTTAVHILCHDHPLRLSPRKKWSCQVCGKEYRATESYFCGSCKYDACKECVDIIGKEDGQDLNNDQDDGNDEKGAQNLLENEDNEIAAEKENVEIVENVENDENLECEIFPVSQDKSIAKYTAWVSGLPHNVKIPEIVRFFKGLKVGYIRLPSVTGKGGRFAYVDFFDSEQFLAALSLHGEMMGSRRITITVAKQRKQNNAGQSTGVPSSNESDDSAANQSDGEYSNQSGYTASTSNRQKKRLHGKRGEKKAKRGGSGDSGVTESNISNEQSNIDPSTNNCITDLPHRIGSLHVEESGSDSDDENESTTDGGDNTSKGKGSRRRGKGNKSRGDRRGRGGPVRGGSILGDGFGGSVPGRGGPGRGGPGRGGPSRGGPGRGGSVLGDCPGGGGPGRGGPGRGGPGRGASSRGGPGRGGPGRGKFGPGRGAYQRPSPASSVPNISICFRCGDFDHSIVDCPLGN